MKLEKNLQVTVRLGDLMELIWLQMASTITIMKYYVRDSCDLVVIGIRYKQIYGNDGEKNDFSLDITSSLCSGAPVEVFLFYNCHLSTHVGWKGPRRYIGECGQ